MPNWQLFYHIVRATKGRQPLIRMEVEAPICGLLRAKAAGSDTPGKAGGLMNWAASKAVVRLHRLTGMSELS
jgi:hypothetical protein